MIRWGSLILDKVCAILDKYRNVGYRCQSEYRQIRDAWIEYNTKVLKYGTLLLRFLQLDSKREMSAEERKKYDSEHRPDLEYCPKKPVSWQTLGECVLFIQSRSVPTILWLCSLTSSTNCCATVPQSLLLLLLKFHTPCTMPWRSCRSL